MDNLEIIHDNLTCVDHHEVIRGYCSIFVTIGLFFIYNKQNNTWMLEKIVFLVLNTISHSFAFYSLVRYHDQHLKYISYFRTSVSYSLFNYWICCTSQLWSCPPTRPTQLTSRGTTLSVIWYWKWKSSLTSLTSVAERNTL